MALQSRVDLARRHVETGRRIVARQRGLVARGTVGVAGEELLELFEAWPSHYGFQGFETS